MTSAGYIMVVEDNRDIRESVVEILEDKGYAVVPAVNGAQALDRLREGAELPSLILLDLMMPVMDGRTFCHEQQHDPRLAHIPVILLTASGEAARQADELGVAGFLPKPLTQKIMLAEVGRHLSK